jgi:hypothetical protein
MMWRRLWAVLSSAAIILLTRWSFRIAKPQEDLHAIRVAWWGVSERVQDAGRVFWRIYGPVTDEMRAAWAELRTRYTTGAYGMEGT